MGYVIAVIGGLGFGVLVALAKHLFIWRSYAQGRAEGVYGRMAISSGVNVLALLLVFLLRGVWPYSFYVTIIATAMALATCNRLFSQRMAKKQRNSAPPDTP